jgi:hypothetical protein
VELHGVTYVAHLGVGVSELLLSGGTLITGTGSGPRANTSAFVDGHRIVSLGVKADTAVTTSNATVVDVSGLSQLWLTSRE